MQSTLTKLNRELAQLCQAIQPSLVRINNGQRGVGAGTIWHEDGLIVTNAHVILSGASAVSDRLSVTLHDGRSMPAGVIAHDVQVDLAALSVAAHGLQAIVRGDSRQIAAGDWVTALGFPWGVPGGATSGVIVGAGDQLPELSHTRREWIAANLHLRPGHSGGPLLNSRGHLIGINTIMTGPDIGGAVPIHVVEEFLKQVDRRQHSGLAGAPPTVQV